MQPRLLCDLSPTELLEHIRSRCQEIGDCWIWTGSRTGSGYPSVGWRGFRSRYVHVIAWSLYTGLDVPRGMLVWRTCSDPGCCNPAHGGLATRRQVGLQSSARGLYRAPSRRLAIAAAVRPRCAKLTVAGVLRIRTELDSSCTALARELGVSKTAACRIRRGIGWPGVGLASQMQLSGLGSTR